MATMTEVPVMFCAPGDDVKTAACADDVSASTVRPDLSPRCRADVMETRLGFTCGSRAAAMPHAALHRSTLAG